MTISSDQLQRIAASGGNVLTANGEKIGAIGQIYLDDLSNEPTWVTVKTALFGTSESLVPLEGANAQDDDIVVGHDKDTVKEAPRVEADRSISSEKEQELYRYYGLTGTGGDYDRGAEDDASAEGVADDQAVADEDAMTRSEERLQVGKEAREVGRARLRKFIVTENVTQTVPVQREEVRVVREPITDANIGDATTGPDVREAEHEVTLHEERPVVQKETVPVERVRLDADTVTEEATVSEEVRKERIDTDVDDDRPRR